MKVRIDVFLQKKPVRVVLVIVLLALVFVSGMFFQKYVISKTMHLPTSYQIDEKIRQKSVLATISLVYPEKLILEVTGSSVPYELIVTNEVKISGAHQGDSINQFVGKKVMVFYLTTTDGRKVLKRVSIVR